MRKKITLTILIITCIIFTLSTNVFATRYSYSIGQRGNNITDSEGNIIVENGFAQNAENSWMHYGNLPTINPEISTITLTGNLLNYPLPNGKHKLESNILFLNGHANPNEIHFSYLDDPRYLTGVYNGNSYTDQSSGRVFVGLNALNLNDTQLVNFVGCSTAKNDNNLLTKAIERGAKVALGFNTEISSRTQQGIRWLNKYNDYLTSFSISDAIYYATAWAPQSNLGPSVVYIYQNGYQNLNLYSLYSNNQNSIDNSTFSTNASTNKNIIKETFLTRQINIPFTTKFNYQKLYDEIKALEPNFNINNYKITEHFYNKEAGNGIIILNYYINDIIKTNKVYMAKIENNIITELTLGGVQKNYINNINSLNEKTLTNKLETKNNIIQRNLTIPNMKSTNTIVTSSEFIYDYNTNTLSQMIYFKTTTKNNFIQYDAMEIIL